MNAHRRGAAAKLALVVLTLAAVGCGATAPSQSSPSSPSPTAGPADLSAIACATEDPGGVGELTGAWAGSKGGIYYIRQVGDCIWWFGTELDDIEPGVTGQPGFANVVSGRVDGSTIIVEWADVPMGDILNGGGLTLTLDAQHDQLEVTEQRGDGVPYGDEALTRIQPSASPDENPSASAASPRPTASSSAAAIDLSAIACGTDDPGDVGELTGAWHGNDSGVYYIRQVGDCVWWFGTEVVDIVPGQTGQHGFANVAAGRLNGSRLDVEWADVPLGSDVNGGGLTYTYDEANGTLVLLEQRGEGEEFGGSVIIRIDPTASPG